MQPFRALLGESLPARVGSRDVKGRRQCDQIGQMQRQRNLRALKVNRDLFVVWRDLHERRNARAETGVLKRAVAVMLDEFNEEYG